MKIVFVVGAGASLPWGYPTGEGLVEQIVLSIENSDIADRWLTKQGYDSQAQEDLARALKTARPASIDQFIANRPEFFDIGRQAITNVIAKAESNPLATQMEHSEFGVLPNWMLTFIRTFFSSKEAPSNHEISIITFNYDRVIEFSWGNWLVHGFGINWEKDLPGFMEWYNKIKIIHVYGRIGNPPWEKIEGQAVRAYGPTGDTALLSTCSKMISTIGRKETNEGAQSARYIMGQAEAVYSLGFGFNDQNCELIGLQGLRENQELISTGIFGRATDRMRERLWSKFNRARKAGEDLDSMKLLRGLSCSALMEMEVQPRHG